ncbi:serine hydrolase domain-containing protein [Marinirhabdus gelatinilytica]|uniref:CubicO group peptidase (Beta-lactamase class C family) n=1 Tax=Marinirhabdus gelatinilytica TaxID=1703343 RepID=A0A370QIZ7_9FLAO|nr:serine hydrolase domain-containing protein [Marinirhabdus gelatinilytica]RDK88328.1 CubicO group peptidase (beta-lactamase class C family) [Marinirhabdus gelatinilytica]
MIQSKTKIKSLFALLLISFSFPSCCSQENKTLITSVSGNTVPSTVLDTKIDSILKSIDMPGLSIAIVNNSELVYHNTFGVINSETKEPVNKKTIFEGASLSKPIFAYFVMKMVEKGILDLDEPLYKYLAHPGIAEVSKEDYRLITARMVLSHRTGFPNHSKGKKIKLAFKPDTDFMYSGEAFQYLAAVIGKLNGVGYKSDLNALFQKEVTKPLRMPNTTFVWNSYIEKHKAFGHDDEGKPTQNNPSYGGWSGKSFNAYSSLHSEAKEYAKFLVALLQQQGLKKETLAIMLKEHTRFKDDNPLKQQIGQTGWGLGMAQKPTEYGMMHMHTGNNHDFQAYMMVLPEKKFGIVFFTNSNKAIPFIQGLNTIIGPIF